MEKAVNNNSETIQRDISIDNLRAVVIVLVVLLHSALAYTSYSIFNPANWIESTAPIVDTRRSIIVDPVVSYLDTFFMPLLFLVSGYFIVSSLTRYGSGRFLIHRIKRLGVPFIFGVLFIAPLSFLPSFLAANLQSSTPYLLRFFTKDGWPIGPPWFLWVLLVFNVIIALLYRVKPALLTRFNKFPKASTIFLITFIAFFPFRLIGHHGWWFSLGPFDLQPIRMGLYFTYVMIGIALSNAGGLPKAEWMRRWPVWLLIGFLGFIAYAVFNGETVRLPNFVSVLIVSLSFAVSCAGSSMGVLGVFNNYGKRMNAFFNSLNVNSFGIFIIHYVFTIWIQYYLLLVQWPALVKFSITFIGSLFLSWGTSIILRKIPLVRSFL